VDSPFAKADGKPSPLRPKDEQKAATMAGLCHTYLKEVGFSLVEVGSGYAIYHRSDGYRVAIQGHLWFCKFPNDEEVSGAGYVGLENLVRGG
jgi:hypothetical protein